MPTSVMKIWRIPTQFCIRNSLITNSWSSFVTPTLSTRSDARAAVFSSNQNVSDHARFLLLVLFEFKFYQKLASSLSDIISRQRCHFWMIRNARKYTERTFSRKCRGCQNPSHSISWPTRCTQTCWRQLVIGQTRMYNVRTLVGSIFADRLNYSTKSTSY